MIDYTKQVLKEKRVYMTPIQLYCKTNKRKRNDQAVGVCAYILQQGDTSKEAIKLLEEETRVARLELMALATGLEELEDTKMLQAGQPIHIYVTNEYILEELQRGISQKKSGKAISFNKGEEYMDLWNTIESLLQKDIDYTVMGLNKKDRDQENEEVKGNMGKLNKMACDEINRFFRKE